MDIGEEERPYVIEPLVEPIPGATPAPFPAEEPLPERVEDPDRELVPA